MEVQPTDDYWQSFVLAIQAGKSFSFKHNTSPGLAVVLESRGLESSLAVDASGVFHAFWSLPREYTGENALFTRSIDASMITGTERMMLSDPIAPISCVFLNEQRVPAALPEPSQVLSTPPGQREVTSSIAMNPLRYHYDALSHTISVDTELVNVGRATLKDPLTLVGTNLHSDFGNPIALNSSRSVAGQPLWYADHILSPGGLASGAHSQVLHLAFRVARFYVPPSLYYDTGDGIAMKVRVYEPKP